MRRRGFESIIPLLYTVVAQLVSAVVLYTRGSRFKSQLQYYSRVIQWSLRRFQTAISFIPLDFFLRLRYTRSIPFMSTQTSWLSQQSAKLLSLVQVQQWTLRGAGNLFLGKTSIKTAIIDYQGERGTSITNIPYYFLQLNWQSH